MGPPVESPLATPLVALAALLPEAAGCTPHQALKEAFQELSSKEVEALRTFEAAGWECVKQLSTDTLVAIRSAAKALTSGDDVQEGSSAQCLVGQNSVKQMFEQFDTNGDGLLSKSQFKEMLTTLGLTEHFSDTEISSLVAAADINSDGSVDLHEFTEWLYASSDGLGVKPDEAEAEDDEAKQEMKRKEDSLRKQLCRTRSLLEAAETAAEKHQQQLADAKRAHEAAKRRSEERLEEELENAHRFWRAVTEATATKQLGKKINMEAATLLGHGKYGYILKSTRNSDGMATVVKMLSLRWAHVAASEWGKAQAAEHPNIVEYADVLVHADEDQAIHNILVEARDAGRLQTRVRRDNFPKQYLCLMQEFMNAGTVQDWMDHNLLLPGGLVVIMQKVASALAHMHLRGLTHNDIKPENVLLSQADETDSRSEVTVKLADLGLAKASTDRTDDYWQYGMTALCMATGEKFGERKYQPESHAEYVETVAACVPPAGTEDGGVLAALSQLPKLLRKVFAQDVTMKEISEMKILQGWSFFDGEVCEEEPDAPDSPRKSAAAGHAINEDNIVLVHKLSARRTSHCLCDPTED